MQQQWNSCEMRQESTRHPFRHIFQLFSVGSAALLLMGIVAACGSTSTPSTSNGKITITEMDYWSIPAQGATLDKLFHAYEQAHPNITIQRNAVPFGDLLPKADQEAA